MADMTRDELTYQALVYRFAAQLLRYPDAGLAVCARGLGELFAVGAREQVLLEKMAACVGQEGGTAADAALELERDYTALFIGALKMLAPPYASYWLDGEHQLGGPTTVALERRYRTHGMVLAQERKQPGDHIATILEFAFVLMRDAAQATEDGETQRADALLGEAQHVFETWIAPWVGDMSALVVSNAKTRFYRYLGELLPLVLVEDSLFDSDNRIGGDGEELGK